MRSDEIRLDFINELDGILATSTQPFIQGQRIICLPEITTNANKSSPIQAPQPSNRSNDLSGKKYRCCYGYLLSDADTDTHKRSEVQVGKCW